MKITCKKQMYKLLTAGLLGNTMPQYDDHQTWHENRLDYDLWGIRSMVPGGRAWMYLSETQADNILCDIKTAFNISPMVYPVTLMAVVYEGYINYVEHPADGAHWRDVMQNAKHAEGVTARHVLRRHLNPSSFDDIMQLQDLYRDHAIEISATPHCTGQLPHRNYVTWEVRMY